MLPRALAVLALCAAGRLRADARGVAARRSRASQGVLRVPTNESHGGGHDWLTVQHQVANLLGAASLREPRGRQPPGMGVTVQVEKAELETLERDLTKDCGGRFSAQIEGDAPEMSEFQGGGDAAKDSPQCQKLEGHLCTTRAKVTQNETAPDGRVLFKEIKVSGSSCLPEECTGGGDLLALAKFLRGRAKELIGSYKITLALHVDCSAEGGAVASLDGAGQPEAPRAEARSGAGPRAALASLAAAALAAAIA